MVSIISVSPLDGARNVEVNAKLLFTFSENIQRGTGDIVLRTAAGTTVETYAAGSSNVTISGDTLTIDPTSDLIDGLEYEVIFASGSVEDLSGNQYGGSADYNFVVGQTQTYNSLAFAKAEALDTRDYRADGEVTVFGVTSPVSGIVFDQEVSTTLFRGDFAYVKTYSETQIRIVDGIENRTSSTFTNYYDTNYVLLAMLFGDYITLGEPAEEGFYNSGTFTVGDSGVIGKWSTYLVADIGDLTVDFSTPSEATESGDVSYAITQREYEGEILDTFVYRDVTGSGFVPGEREILLDETGAVVSRRGSNAGQDYLSTFILTATSNLDVLAPTVTAFSPQDGAIDFSPSSDIVVTFSEDISRSNGDIVLKTAAGSTVATYGYRSPEVVVNGNTLTINPSSDLNYATEYVVEFKTGSVIDIAGNENTSVTDYNFTVAPLPDTTAPTVATFSPADSYQGASVSANLVVTFSEDIQRGTGDIVLRTAAGTTVETYATGSSNVTISGDTLTIDPTSDLIDGLEYEVIFASGSVEDLSGNQYGGSADYNFVVGQTQTYNSLAFAKAEALDTRDYRADGEVTVFGVTSPVSGIVFDQEVSTTLFRGDFAYVKQYSETEIQIVDGVENRSSSTFTNYYDTNYVLLATLVGDYITLVEQVEESFYKSGTFAVGDSGVVANWSTYLVEDIADLTVDFSPPSEATESGDVSYAITQREYEGEILDTVVVRNVTDGEEAAPERVILLASDGSIASRRGTNTGQDYLATYTLTAASDLDVLAPTVTAFSPQDGAIDFSPSSDIVVTFSEDISRSNGDIVLKTAAGSTVATYGYRSPEVVVNGNTLTINPSSDLNYATEYVVEFKTGSVIDIAGNENTSVTDYNFTVAPLPDRTAPTVATFSPADSYQGASVSANLVVTFSEDIQRGSGQIILKTSSGTTIETYSADSSNVTISGNKLVIDPTYKLDYKTQYVLTLPSGIVEDLAGNSLASAATHNFTTRAQGAGYDVAPKFKHWNKGADAGSERLLSKVKVAVGENFALSDDTGDAILEGVEDLDDTDDGIITPVVTYDKVADKDDASINLSDVIASLKLFLGLNLPDAYRSPYNYVAADLDANGKVELSDVISLLKVFLKLPVANTQAMEWVFVKDSVSPTDVNGQPFDKDHATPPPITHDFSESAEVNILGILRGDVDGSWIPPTAT